MHASSTTVATAPDLNHLAQAHGLLARMALALRRFSGGSVAPVPRAGDRRQCRLRLLLGGCTAAAEIFAKYGDVDRAATYRLRFVETVRRLAQNFERGSAAQELARCVNNADDATGSDGLAAFAARLADGACRTRLRMTPSTPASGVVRRDGSTEEGERRLRIQSARASTALDACFGPRRSSMNQGLSGVDPKAEFLNHKTSGNRCVYRKP